LLAARGAAVSVADHHPERRAQASELGARGVEWLAGHELVFEAVGRPESWRAAVEAAAPGGVVVLVGGCAAGADVTLPATPLHYDELELRGAFHHSRQEVDEALAALAAEELEWRILLGPRISLEELPAALGASADGRATKWVVEPRL
jgi:L-iditol 2-dehydrogenase